MRGIRVSRWTAAVAIVALGTISACSSDGNDAPAASVGEAPAVTFSTAAPTEPPTEPPTAPSVTTTTVPSAPPSTAPATAPLADPVVALAPVVSLNAPLDAAWRAGDTTIYVVEQEGRIVPVRDGAAGDPVLDITGRIRAGGERGLLGLTFSPDGSLAYVDYTNTGGDTVIAEYAVGADGTIDVGSERVLMRIDQPYSNHNGGNVTIGPDGYLYIGMGDGGSGGDPERRSLNVSQLLGKILRIDPTASGDAAYTVPADNPFVGVDGARPEIWSVGVRNPWRMSFDPATGDLWFGDVGQGDWEEIDVSRATDGAGRGVNFGWSAFEGTHRYNEDQPADGATPPVYEYSHSDGGCSVSGGAVYRGTAIPALVGWYVFGDYCSGDIVAILVDGTTVTRSVTFAGLPALGAIRAAPDGELYAISLDGTVARLVPG